ncbi:MAG: molecular chaperone [Hyphomicrobiales bacterium]
MRGFGGGALAVLGLLGLATEAHALKVSPLSLEIVAPNGATSLNLEADSSDPVTVQIRVMRWTQVDGEDVLEPTTDLVASPPFATLQARTNYTIRLVRQAKGAVEREYTYRLLIDQLPVFPKGKSQVIGLTLRHSVPVFVRANGVSKSKLDWSVKRDETGLVVTATNTGGRTARLTDIRMASGGTSVPVRSGLAGYVLPGQSMSWRTPAPRGIDGRSVRISAKNAMEAVNAEIEVSP